MLEEILPLLEAVLETKEPLLIIAAGDHLLRHRLLRLRHLLLVNLLSISSSTPSFSSSPSPAGTT